MSNKSDLYFRIEPIFKLKTPLLFSHRGGAREVPESTVRGFRHAIDAAQSDVLELDVQLTRDGELVVWHGPELSNVRIDGQANRPLKRERNKIYDFDWAELDGKAWVADPDVKDRADADIDLAAVPKEDDRCLLRLADFLKKFPKTPLNVEIKESFSRKINETDRKGLKDNIRALNEMLVNDSGSRKIVVVSANDIYIQEFRRCNREKFPSGLSTQEQLVLLLPLAFFGMKNRALETSYSQMISNKIMVQRIRNLGGSTFVFLTEFGRWLPAIDKDMPSDEAISEILDRGVDGIMTDRPECVRKIMNKWIASRS
jgi:glycerophosphoryl diester phosphodiesterase